jgi:hypothetical protein
MKYFEQHIQPFILIKGEHSFEEFQAVEKAQQQAIVNFPNLVENSRLNLWKPGDSISMQRIRFLIGVRVVSRYDMRLLDALNRILLSDQIMDERIDVFSCETIATIDEFDQYIPGIKSRMKSHQTPTVGMWKDGHLVEIGHGYSGRQLVLDYFNLSIDLN